MTLVCLRLPVTQQATIEMMSIGRPIKRTEPATLLPTIKLAVFMEVLGLKVVGLKLKFLD